VVETGAGQEPFAAVPVIPPPVSRSARKSNRAGRPPTGPRYPRTQVTTRTIIRSPCGSPLLQYGVCLEHRAQFANCDVLDLSHTLLAQADRVADFLEGQTIMPFGGEPL
jgi:hypothetical protein